jgi:hypothetical protein
MQTQATMGSAVGEYSLDNKSLRPLRIADANWSGPSSLTCSRGARDESEPHSVNWKFRNRTPVRLTVLLWL